MIQLTHLILDQKAEEWCHAQLYKLPRCFVHIFFFFIYTYICSRSIHFTYEKMTSWKLHGSIATSLNFRSNKYHYHSPLKKKNGPFWSHILIMIVSNLVRKLGLAMRANSLEHFRQPETVFLQESIQIYIIQAVPSQCCWHIKKLRSVNWN